MYACIEGSDIMFFDLELMSSQKFESLMNEVPQLDPQQLYRKIILSSNTDTSCLNILTYGDDIIFPIPTFCLHYVYKHEYITNFLCHLMEWSTEHNGDRNLRIYDKSMRSMLPIFIMYVKNAQNDAPKVCSMLDTFKWGILIH